MKEQITKFLNPEEQKQAINSSLRKAFRVHCDFFEPDSDEWLGCKYLFENLYMLRDSEARGSNVGPEQLLSNEHLYLMARAGTKTDLLAGESAFIDKAVKMINEWMINFPKLRVQLIEDSKKDAVLGSQAH